MIEIRTIKPGIILTALMCYLCQWSFEQIIQYQHTLQRTVFTINSFSILHRFRDFFFLYFQWAQYYHNWLIWSFIAWNTCKITFISHAWKVYLILFFLLGSRISHKMNYYNREIIIISLLIIHYTCIRVNRYYLLISLKITVKISLQ